MSIGGGIGSVPGFIVANGIVTLAGVLPALVAERCALPEWLRQVCQIFAGVTLMLGPFAASAAGVGVGFLGRVLDRAAAAAAATIVPAIPSVIFVTIVHHAVRPATQPPMLTRKMILEEPYRVFFPLGMLAAIWGVMMWPLMYAGLLRFYPGEAHTRMMIEGFMGAFVLGFSGTAFPRLTGNRSWFGGEFCALLLLWALTVASHAAGRVAAGDAAFAALLVVLFSGLAGRWIFGHRDTPPPGFVLAFAGILGAAIAAGWLARANNPAPGLNPLGPAVALPGLSAAAADGHRSLSATAVFRHEQHPFVRRLAHAARRLVATDVLSAIAAGLLVAASFALEVSGRAAAGHCCGPG